MSLPKIIRASRHWSACTLTAICAALLPFQAVSQQACNLDAMLVFDGSGSMGEMGFNRLDMPRIVDARQAVRQVAPRIAPFRRLGLIVYGPGAEDSCANIDLRFAPMADSADRLIAEVAGLEPSGETPLTEAVALAARVLMETGDPDEPGVVVLITDGKDTCDGAPCELAAQLAADKQITVHVIGFKLRGRHFAFPGGKGDQEYSAGITVARCLADQTGGIYTSSETVSDLIGALQQTLGCAVYGAVAPQSDAVQKQRKIAGLPRRLTLQ